ncbi:MAG TPA: N-acetylneuraminate synthase [Candidatus Omnitrophota bacterium]|nr:N-acetylneuraminate synthase [Candidatus Omnitrophota bacterium]HRZ15285.1 N-acetylneuraminate synthase [Candidatus Omnitrophota bacterium]
MGHKVYIIAEAGVNHNGSLAAAKRMVDAARAAGCDAVKFQTFKADAVVIARSPQSGYQLLNTRSDEPQREMLRKLELSYREFEALFRYCARKKIDFLSTPFDLESVDFLGALGMKIFKIPSGEVTNKPLIERIAGKYRAIIMSTGMCYVEEIRTALGWIRKVQAAGAVRPQITLLHCVSQYPALPVDVNISAMAQMRSMFKLPVGFSDHTLGIEISIAAAALGASVLEKHFTLDRSLPGPDHAASLEPEELKALVKAVRSVEMAIGDGVKKPVPAEMLVRRTGRRSIVAARAIQKGERFTPENITCKRPAGGVSASEWDRVIGLRAKRAFIKDQRIRI